MAKIISEMSGSLLLNLTLIFVTLIASALLAWLVVSLTQREDVSISALFGCRGQFPIREYMHNGVAVYKLCDGTTRVYVYATPDSTVIIHKKESKNDRQKK